MNKFELTVVVVVFLCSSHLHAQNNKNPYDDLPSYNHYLLNEYDITSNAPSSFIDLNQFFVMRRVQKDRETGSIYGPIFQTRDKECLVMYPALPQYVSERDMEGIKMTAVINRALKGDTSLAEPEVKTPQYYNNVFPRAQVTAEVKAASGLYDHDGKPLQDSVRFNFNDHVTIIAGRKAKEMFNADSIYIYDLPLQEPYQDKYTHRTGVVLAKDDRATMVFKFFFTPEGKKEEEKYIDMLSQHVWYNEDFKHEE